MKLIDLIDISYIIIYSDYLVTISLILYYYNLYNVFILILFNIYLICYNIYLKLI